MKSQNKIFEIFPIILLPFFFTFDIKKKKTASFFFQYSKEINSAKCAYHFTQHFFPLAHFRQTLKTYIKIEKRKKQKIMKEKQRKEKWCSKFVGYHFSVTAF